MSLFWRTEVDWLHLKESGLDITAGADDDSLFALRGSGRMTEDGG